MHFLKKLRNTNAADRAHSHPTAIHLFSPDASSTLPSFPLMHPSILPLPHQPTSTLPLPQITAVFTRALRDLPTRPRVRSHLPHQTKKNPTQILAGKLPARSLPRHSLTLELPAACMWTHGNAAVASCRPCRHHSSISIS